MAVVTQFELRIIAKYGSSKRAGGLIYFINFEKKGEVNVIFITNISYAKLNLKVKDWF